MNIGKTLFAQLMDFLPWTTFARYVQSYGGDGGVRTLPCAEQFRIMAFAQLTYRESLRDIEVCLSAQAGKFHDVHALDLLIPEAGAIYVMDRAYVDFARLHVLHLAGSFFVTRAKSNLDAHRVYSSATDRNTGVICDQAIALDGFYTQRDYPEHLRRIRFKDPESGKTLVFLTNQMTLPTLTICALYKSRWQVELFFKWIKQHLRIKRFFGTSENAVKSQIWIAVSVYVLVAIVKKRLNLDASLYTLLQILSVTLFEKMPLQQAFPGSDSSSNSAILNNQLNLFAV